MNIFFHKRCLPFSERLYVHIYTKYIYLNLDSDNQLYLVGELGDDYHALQPDKHVRYSTPLSNLIFLYFVC